MVGLGFVFFLVLPIKEVSFASGDTVDWSQKQPMPRLKVRARVRFFFKVVSDS